MTLAQRWRAWLFERGDLRALAICRMGWALAMLFAVWHESGLAKLYSSAQYHVPLVPGLVPLQAAVFAWLMRAAALGGVLALLGLYTRVGIALVCASLGYLFALDLLLFRNHIYLGLLIGGLLVVSPAGQVLSLDSALARWRGKPTPHIGCLAAAKLIRLQVLIVYGYSVVNKLRWSFLDGFVLERELPSALRQGPLYHLLREPQGGLRPAVSAALSSSETLAVLSWLVVAAEAFLALGLPSRPLRPYAVAVGLVLHLGIFLTMGIHVFGLLMVSSYALFTTGRPAALRA